MAILTRTALKALFENGDTPTAANFIDLIDSFYALGEANASIAPTVSAVSVPTSAAQLISVFGSPVGDNLALLRGTALYSQYPSDTSNSKSTMIQSGGAQVLYGTYDVPFTLAHSYAIVLTANFSMNYAGISQVSVVLQSDILGGWNDILGTARAFAGGNTDIGCLSLNAVCPPANYRFRFSSTVVGNLLTDAIYSQVLTGE